MTLPWKCLWIIWPQIFKSNWKIVYASSRESNQNEAQGDCNSFQLYPKACNTNTNIVFVVHAVYLFTKSIEWVSFYRTLLLDLCYMISRRRFEKPFSPPKIRRKYNQTAQFHTASFDWKQNEWFFYVAERYMCSRQSQEPRGMTRFRYESYIHNQFLWYIHRMTQYLSTMRESHTHAQCFMWNERKRKEPMLIKTLFHVLTCRPYRVYACPNMCTPFVCMWACARESAHCYYYCHCGKAVLLSIFRVTCNSTYDKGSSTLSKHRDFCIASTDRQCATIHLVYWYIDTHMYKIDFVMYM